MTVTIQVPAKGVLLTVDDVRHWKARLATIDGEIAALLSQKEDFARKLAAAAMFLDVDSVEASEDVAAEAALDPLENEESPSTEASEKSPIDASKPKKRRKYGRLTWRDVIIEAVSGAEIGLTYAELRAAVRESALGAQLDHSDKGYHNAISRCAAHNEIIRDHGRVFTHEAFTRFMAAVDAGEASTAVPQPLAYSPMGEAILDIVAEQPGQLNGKGVIRELRKDTEFNATLTPHETSAYNIIARLVRRGQLIRRDDGSILPGRNFPQDRARSDVNSIEAPNGLAVGASEAGGVAAPSPDSQPTLRLIS